MKKKVLALVGVAIIAVIASFIVLRKEQSIERTQVAQQQTDAEEESSENKSLKVFTGEEFRALFDNLSLPNTTPIVDPPEITGDLAADKHIQKLAEARGYKLRLVAASQLTSENGVELQVLALNDWQKLTEAAKKDGINLKITSAYRSVKDQQDLFREELAAQGLTASKIVSGAADPTINTILQTMSPPGYSRHHSGYTIDVSDESATVFKYSKGYEWISKNNFENAKRFGFIPSYPEEVESQGPEPEPWEFVWANRDFIVE